MPRNTAVVRLLVLGGTLGWVGCPKPTDSSPPSPTASASASASKPKVFTLAYPTEWLARQIGADAVEVIDVRPEHDDPTEWAPTQENIFTIQEDAIVILVGGGFEPWYRPADFAPFSVFQLVEPLGPAAIERPGGGPNPYVWLEPEALDLVAGGLADHLAGSMPDQAEGFRARRAALSKRLAELDRALRTQMERLPPLFSSRVGYEHAARAFGWNLQVLAVDPMVAPDPEVLEQWRVRRSAHRARLVLFAAPPAEVVKAALRSVGLEPVVFSLLTHRSAEDREAGRDYFDLMRANVARLVEAAAALAASPAGVR